MSRRRSGTLPTSGSIWKRCVGGLLPKDDINRVRYFTARITARPDDPQQALRQQVHLWALTTLPLVSIHYGRTS